MLNITIHRHKKLLNVKVLVFLAKEIIVELIFSKHVWTFEKLVAKNFLSYYIKTTLLQIIT